MEQLDRQDSVIVAGIRGGFQYYVPYLQTVEKIKGDRYRLSYNGGDVDVDLRVTEGILFYGATGGLPVAFLDAANQHRVTITIHRTHQAEPMVMASALMPGRADLLTQQILRREDGRLRIYLAREVCAARVASLSRLIPVSRTALAAVRRARTPAELRTIEAEQSARYWDAYFDRAGQPDQTRRGGSAIARALEAAGMMVRGILLRWVLHHRLSPAHGFLHEPTGYPSLVFDLIEPYRYLVEEAVLAAVAEAGPDLRPSTAIEALKARLRQPAYVPATRQWVPAKSLLHGVVLALRAYLAGDMLRFVIPVEGPVKAGRPYQTSYRLPAELKGAIAPTARPAPAKEV